LRTGAAGALSGLSLTPSWLVFNRHVHNPSSACGRLPTVEAGSCGLVHRRQEQCLQPAALAVLTYFSDVLLASHSHERCQQPRPACLGSFCVLRELRRGQALKSELAPVAASTQATPTRPLGPRSRRSARQTLLALAISVGLALTPELVRTVVEGRPPALVARLWLPPGLRARAAAPAPAQPRVAALDAAAAEQPWADVEVRASGIRCAGCAARVRRAVLDALPAG